MAGGGVSASPSKRGSIVWWRYKKKQKPEIRSTVLPLCPGNKVSVTQQWISCCLKPLSQRCLTWSHSVIRIQQLHLCRRNLLPGCLFILFFTLFLCFFFFPAALISIAVCLRPCGSGGLTLTGGGRFGGWSRAEAATGRGPIIDGLLKGCG